MARRKRRDEIGFVRPAVGLLGAGVAFGVGASLVEGVGGSTAASAGKGLAVGASFLPVAATAVGGFIVVRQLQGLQRQVEQQTKRRRKR